jgi:hypothetical protein
VPTSSCLRLPEYVIAAEPTVPNRMVSLFTVLLTGLAGRQMDGAAQRGPRLRQTRLNVPLKAPLYRASTSRQVGARPLEGGALVVGEAAGVVGLDCVVGLIERLRRPPRPGGKGTP